MSGKTNGAAILNTTTPQIDTERSKGNKINTFHSAAGSLLQEQKKKAPNLLNADFSGEKIDNRSEVQPGSTKTLADFEAFRVTKEKNIPRTPPRITIGGAPVAAPDNITPITAEGKGGKTAFKNVIVAGAISPTGIIDGFEGVEVEPNPNGKAVVDLDTEQSEADQQYNLIKALERTGLKETPEFYQSYNIRTLPLGDYRRFTIDLLEACNKKFNGIHLIIVDGGADYIKSVNDEEEANAAIAFFTWAAVEYRCPVIIVIHLNENAARNGDTMPRGHLGRQAIRKGYCQINITKEGEISTLQVLRARKASIAETPLICYRYDKEKGYHVSVDADSISNARQSEKEQASRKRAEKIALEVFAPPTALLHKDAIYQIMKKTSKSESTAKRTLNDMEGWDIVKKHDDGYYRLLV